MTKYIKLQATSDEFCHFAALCLWIILHKHAF